MASAADISTEMAIIQPRARWYLRYELPYRDVEELLAERGVQVNHVSVFKVVMRP